MGGRTLPGRPLGYNTSRHMHAQHAGERKERERKKRQHTTGKRRDKKGRFRKVTKRKVEELKNGLGSKLQESNMTREDGERKTGGLREKQGHYSKDWISKQ